MKSRMKKRRMEEQNEEVYYWEDVEEENEEVYEEVNLLINLLFKELDTYFVVHISKTKLIV